LDKEHILKTSDNIAEMQLRLQELKAMLKEMKDKEQKIEIKSNVNLLQKEITEANRRLNNYLNTGDENLSRLQAKFN
jgi:protein subunit release factor A